MDITEVRTLVDRALADGRITQVEIAEIEAAIMADGKVSQEEVALLEEIRLKVLRGEIKVG